MVKSSSISSNEQQQNRRNSCKGIVHLSILKQNLTNNIPELSSKKGLSILDAGGGKCEIAEWLAELGHNIKLCDLTTKTQSSYEHQFPVEDNKSIELVNSPLNKLSRIFTQGQFDIILLHGVIEWSTSPLSVIQLLSPLLKKNGILSILYLNKDKQILKWGINGQFEQAISGETKVSKTIVPVNPLSEYEVLPLLMKLGFKDITKAGISIFCDILSNENQFQPSAEEIIQLEVAHNRNEPFASLGEHTHYTCRK